MAIGSSFSTTNDAEKQEVIPYLLNRVNDKGGSIARTGIHLEGDASLHAVCTARRVQKMKALGRKIIDRRGRGLF